MKLDSDTAQQILDGVRDEYDGALRGFGCFEGGEYRLDYLRDDVAEKISEEKVHEMLEEAQFSALENPIYEDLYESELEAVVRIFGRTVAITVPIEENSGVLLSLDRTADFRGRTVIETVEESLSEAESSK